MAQLTSLPTTTVFAFRLSREAQRLRSGRTPVKSGRPSRRQCSRPLSKLRFCFPPSIPLPPVLCSLLLYLYAMCVACINVFYALVSVPLLLVCMLVGVNVRVCCGLVARGTRTCGSVVSTFKCGCKYWAENCGKRRTGESPGFLPFLSASRCLPPLCNVPRDDHLLWEFSPKTLHS
jgi:hypothetical protein